MDKPARAAIGNGSITGEEICKRSMGALDNNEK